MTVDRNNSVILGETSLADHDLLQITALAILGLCARRECLTNTFKQCLLILAQNGYQPLETCLSNLDL